MNKTKEHLPEKREPSHNSMHLTVRMAWHDNNWDGHVCQDPESNSYCVGAHSLLSGRIEKKRDLDFEKKRENKGRSLSELKVNEIPPCYWSINAFGKQTFKIEQGHAFKGIKEKIPDTVGPYSFYTWPFKLSFNHDKAKKKKHGNYPPDLEKRIEDFTNKFTPKKSIVFFYANYDNPVSADEMKYLLIGCSVLSAPPKRTWFPFSKKFVEEWSKKSHKMKHFPKINWALHCTHDPESLVLLPYKEYVKYVESNPEDVEKLNEMRVVIEEESLVRGFKYVGMDIDDDKCLYLLYKMRKALKKIQEHNQVVIRSDFSEQEKQVEKLIQMVWEKRGLHPSLAKIFNHFVGDEEVSEELATAANKAASEGGDLSSIFTGLLKGKVPKSLKNHQAALDELVENRKFKKHYQALLKLSLFNLTSHQIKRIIEDEALLKRLDSNPYVLYEDYEAKKDNLDSPDLTDEPIDVYKVDVGMIPDRKYVNRNKSLQNLTEDSPERVRSVIVNYLWSLGEQGHCYDTIDRIINDIQEHPLIYKNDIKIDADAIRKPDEDYRTHFMERLAIVADGGTQYYYLNEITKAENQVKQFVQSLLGRKNHAESTFDFKQHISASVLELKKKIRDFDEELFVTEREQLYTNVFTKSFFLLTGRPGSGKTFETSKIVEELRKRGEGVVVLAPTGKAVLRLREVLGRKDDPDTVIQTIDRFICAREYDWAYDDWETLDELADKEKQTIDNLIIDECSMIDLEKFKVLLSIIKQNDKTPRRVIMVGDENQLPPIGFGKPFHDIITFIWRNEDVAKRHYVHLKTNCRQENDPLILKLAEAFTDRRRYYEEALEIVKKEGKVSDGLFVHHWRNKEEFDKGIKAAIDTICELELSEELKQRDLDKVQRLNRLFGLYDNGSVNNKDYKFQEYLKLDSLQLLSPYRSSSFGSGTIGNNALIQQKYRERNNDTPEKKFLHSDKIINLKNWYKWQNGKVDLLLSNGSIGVVKGEGRQRKYYFVEHKYPLDYLNDEENFELAYSITVHKSQGSDFRNVLFILPNKLTLLSRELIYTALTRSRYRLFIFVQRTDENLFSYARGISHLLARNTSTFEPPEDRRGKYYPERGAKPVKSKVEWIIYTALRNSGLRFVYEAPLKLKNLSYEIHPDFTITSPNGETYYWEHLGMLDSRKYYRDWQERKRHYEEHGLMDNVVTTDDLRGIKDEFLEAVVQDLRERELKRTPDSRFSMHHYELA